jgi:hypothetical protein
LKERYLVEILPRKKYHINAKFKNKSLKNQLSNKLFSWGNLIIFLLKLAQACSFLAHFCSLFAHFLLKFNPSLFCEQNRSGLSTVRDSACSRLEAVGRLVPVLRGGGISGISR